MSMFVSALPVLRRGRSIDATRSRAWLLLALVGAASAHPIAPCVGDCSANASASRVTRRLTVTTVQPGVNLQTVVDIASPGDEIVLGDGTYTGTGTSASGNNMLYINKDITIRALNPGQAVLDGETARRVLYVQSGAVALEGLKITRGRATGVSGLAPFGSSNAPMDAFELTSLLVSCLNSRSRSR